ncbi:protein of unknown function [Candidatus Methylacidiphilum fumarolicum]|uniref:Uncharacterized protein n=1 Tax=Candidatus Methylacidiphilum fumarolicum TaxID=591154 RepID=A0ABM9I9V1_9BACT|nr:protein of unknown function [Candidatus Methylacidiphilum fumarolicum]
MFPANNPKAIPVFSTKTRSKKPGINGLLKEFIKKEETQDFVIQSSNRKRLKFRIKKKTLNK